MLRDSQVYRPWYESNNRHLLRAEGNFDAKFLHDWTVEVQKQPRTYGALMQAALDYPIAAHMCELPVHITIAPAETLMLNAAE